MTTQWLLAPLFIGLLISFHLCCETFLLLRHYQPGAPSTASGVTQKGNLFLLVCAFSFFTTAGLAISLGILSIPGLLVTCLVLLLSRLTFMGQWIGIWSLARLKRWLNH